MLETRDKALFVPSQSLFSQTFLWKFCNQIPLAFKVKFPGGSQYLCWILRLGNLLWALELLQQCENFFGLTLLQFCGANGDLLQEDLHHTHLPGLLQPEPLSAPQAAADPCLCNTHRQVWLRLFWGHCSFPWVLVCTKFCLHPSSISGGYEI